MTAALPKSPRKRPLAGVLITGALAVALSACETAQEGYDSVSLLWSTPIILPCPEFKIVADAARLVKFRDGPGRDLIDVDVEGLIGNVTLACLSKINKKTRQGSMEVEATVVFGAQRGPANATRKAILPYFITVTDLNKTILYREKFKVGVIYPGNQTSAKFAGENVTLQLPIDKKISQKDYVIYTGFQLTREQLEYNRAAIKARN